MTFTQPQWPVPQWLDIGALSEIPIRGARTVPVSGGIEIAVFRTAGNRVYALHNSCPHKQGPLSQGIVHGTTVTCPLHNWVISLESGQAQGADNGCTPTISVKVDGGRVLIARAEALGQAA